jgi:hypothetical protein
VTSLPYVCRIGVGRIEMSSCVVSEENWTRYYGKVGGALCGNNVCTFPSQKEWGGMLYKGKKYMDKYGMFYTNE